MNGDSPVQPALVEFYDRYLVDRDVAAFTRLVRDRYLVTTLERLAEWGGRITRRAAVLALGQVGDYAANPVLGRALTDRDRGVRTLADGCIRLLWRRVGSEGQRRQLDAMIHFNSAKQFTDAIHLGTQLLQEVPWFAEAWNQRALAHFHRGEYDDSIRDCHQTLEINPYHFPAATGMGKCYLHLSNRVAALEAFRRALRLNPGLDDVRAHVVYLQRMLKED